MVTEFHDGLPLEVQFARWEAAAHLFATAARLLDHPDMDKHPVVLREWLDGIATATRPVQIADAVAAMLTDFAAEARKEIGRLPRK